MIGERGARALVTKKNSRAVFMQLVYAESLGLYGLIMGLILLAKNNK